MSAVARFWGRLPVVARAILAGAALAAAGALPWALLSGANLEHGASVPWAVPPTAFYLWLFWRYARGAGWPRSTAEARHASARETHVSAETWGTALLAGVLGLATLVLFLRVLNRVVRLPQEQVPDVSHMSLVTLFFLLLTGAAVAGVVEEVSFRGWMQAPIERRHGPVVAILVTGMLFGVAHFTHPEVTLVLMPYYLLAAAIYGALAHLTNSVLPSMVLHACGNFVGGIGLLTSGHREWQAAPIPAPLIGDAGPDAAFWVSCAGMLLVGAAAVWAYAQLAAVARGVPATTH